MGVQNNEQKPSASDFLKNNKPEAFATMSGMAPGNNQFNMASFGTMQVGSNNKAEFDLNFMGKKQNVGMSNGGANLI